MTRGLAKFLAVVCVVLAVLLLGYAAGIVVFGAAQPDRSSHPTKPAPVEEPIQPMERREPLPPVFLRERGQ